MITDQMVEAAIIANRRTVGAYITGVSGWPGDYDDDEQAIMRESMRAALEAAEAAAWQPIETAPKNQNLFVLVRREGSKFERVQHAIFMEKYKHENDGEFSEYCEETDTYYTPEGWYEVCYEHDEYSAMAMSDMPTHWRALPAAPKETT